MYAIVTIAGQQFKVEKGKKVIVHQLPSEVGEEVTFEKVLLIDNDGKISVGTPYVTEAAVTAQVVSHLRGDKIKVFKKKRRKGYQVLNGHRQYFTELMIEEIIESGFVRKEPKPKKATEPKIKAEKPAPEEAIKTEAKAVSVKKPVKSAGKKTAEPKEATEKVKPAAHQSVAFSYLDYGKPVKVYPDSTAADAIPENLYTVFLIAGIANPYPLEEYIKRSCVDLYTFRFPDHHQFTVSEIQNIAADFDRHLMKSKVIFTTEKDVARLMAPEIKEKLVHLPLFYIPVNIGFHDSKDVNAEQLILDYVGKNFKNS